MTRIIVVDDDARVRMAAQILLEESGIETVGAEDGAAALRTVRHVGTDLVLCDLFMPDCDGLEVIQALRREFPNVKVVAMSGGAYNGKIDLLSVARQLGAAEILHKPFTQKGVIEVIERVLGSLSDAR